MFLALEVQELLKQQLYPVVVVEDNAARPGVSLTEAFSCTNDAPPPLAPYRSSHRPAAVRRRRRRKLPIEAATTATATTPLPAPPSLSSMPSRWDACCYSPIKASNLNVRNHEPNHHHISPRLQLSSLREFNNFPSPPPLSSSSCTNSEALKMPVRRGSIEHNDMEKISPLQESHGMGLKSTAMAPTIITSSIRDFHLQQRRLYEQQQGEQQADVLPTHRHRRHSYEKCGGTESTARRHDTARVLDEALSLLNLGV
jgi:hypothetical protein